MGLVTLFGLLVLGLRIVWSAGCCFGFVFDSIFICTGRRLWVADLVAWFGLGLCLYLGLLVRCCLVLSLDCETV